MLLRRSALCVSVVLLSLLGASAATSASAPGTPAEIASAFTSAFYASDGRTCDLASAEVQALLARLTKSRSCAASMATLKLADALASGDDEKDQLQVAYDAATSSLVEHYSTLYGRAWFGKGYPIAALARDIHASEPELRIRLGAGPATARGSAANLIVLDTVRSTPRRLVLHGESSDGSIWSASGTPGGRAGFSRSTVRGVAVPPAHLAVKTYAFKAAEAADPTLVVASFISPDDGELAELLLPVGPDGRVQSFLAGRAVFPPTAGAGAGDAAAFAATLTHAYAAGDAALCPLVDPVLVKLLGSECSIAGKPTTAIDVTTPAQRVTTLDGSTVVAVKVGKAPDQMTAYNLAVPTAAGYRVSGIFVDIAEMLQVLDQPA